MAFLERHFPFPAWVLRGIQARGLTPHLLRIQPEIRAARASARAADAPVIDPETIPDSAFLQIRLFRKDHTRFLEVDPRIEDLRLGEDEVLFVPQSVIVNRYILFYNDVYLPTDLGTFLDPAGTMNARFFKTIPAWGIGRAVRSNHPGIEVGTSYHGFFPLGPYSVRRIGDVDPADGTALQDPPGFRGPLEWLRLVRADGHPPFVADLFEYFKIGICFAAALRDLEAYGAEQLVLTSASSASAQVIAACVREALPGLSIVGLTSARNLPAVKELSAVDEATTYDDLHSIDGTKPSLYFDVLGNEAVSLQCLEHFDLRRWWTYGQGGQKAMPKLLRRNRRGSEYSNGIDSLLYADRNGISDTDILTRGAAIATKHDLERRLGTQVRTISHPRELYELYRAFVDETHPPGERVRYVSPLLERSG